jgi:hypothetical protein
MSSNKEWPTLEDLHLEAIIFAYNDGFSKSYERRVFPNPFTENGSQAAAYDKGVRDGTNIRGRDDRVEAEKLSGKNDPNVNTVLEELTWIRSVLAEYGYSGPLREADCPLRELLARES